MKDKRLEGMKAILASPTYGYVEPVRQKELRVAMMSASNSGLEWAGDASTEKASFSVARNFAAQSLYEGKGEVANGIIWVDSDMSLAPADLFNLVYSAKVYNADFVTGVYFHRVGDPRPVLYDYSHKTRKFRQLESFPRNAFFQTDGCGFGIVWTSYELIRKIKDEYKKFDPDKGSWFPDRRDAGGFGEDLSFCEMAMKIGVKLFANTAIIVKHMAEPELVGLEHHEKYLEDKKNEASRQRNAEDVSGEANTRQ